MNLVSQNGYILVSAVLPGEVSVSGIIITPEKENDEQIAKGRVVVGNDKIKIGSIVLFNKLVPSDITISENTKDSYKESKFFSLHESEIMFIESSKEPNENNTVQ